MHCSINLTIVFFIAFVLFVGVDHHVGVNAIPSPEDEQCSNCWRSERSKIVECQNIPSFEVQTLEDNPNQLSQNKGLFPNLIGCLCALSQKAEDILKVCQCPQEMANGLREQSLLIEQQVCTVTVDTSNASNDNSSSTSSTEVSNPAPSTGNYISSSSRTVVNSWIFSSILCLLILLFNY